MCCCALRWCCNSWLLPCRHNSAFLTNNPYRRPALARHSPPTHARPFSDHGTHSDLMCVCLRGSKVECNLPRTRTGESRPRACCHHHRHNDTHLGTSTESTRHPPPAAPRPPNSPPLGSPLPLSHHHHRPEPRASNLKEYIHVYVYAFFFPFPFEGSGYV